MSDILEMEEGKGVSEWGGLLDGEDIINGTTGIKEIEESGGNVQDRRLLFIKDSRVFPFQINK